MHCGAVDALQLKSTRSSCLAREAAPTGLNALGR